MRHTFYDKTCKICGKQYKTRTFHSEACSMKCRKELGRKPFKVKNELSKFQAMEKRKELFIASQRLFWIKKHLPDEVSRFRKSGAALRARLPAFSG